MTQMWQRGASCVDLQDEAYAQCYPPNPGLPSPWGFMSYRPVMSFGSSLTPSSPSVPMRRKPLGTT